MAKNYVEETVDIKIDVDINEARKTLTELQEKLQNIFGIHNIGQSFNKSFTQSLTSLVKLGGIAEDIIDKFVALKKAQQELDVNFNYENLQKFSTLYGEVTLAINKASAQLKAQGKLLETERETLTRVGKAQQKAIQLLERKFALLTSVNAEEIKSEVLRNRLLTEQKNILDRITKITTLPEFSGDINKDLAILKEFEARIKNLSQLTPVSSIKELLSSIKEDLKKTREEAAKLDQTLLSNVKELNANARMSTIDRRETLSSLAKQRQEYERLNAAQSAYYKQSLNISKFVKEELAKLESIKRENLAPQQLQVLDAAERKLQELGAAIKNVWKYDETKPSLLTAEIKAQQDQVSKLAAEYKTQLQPAIKEVYQSFSKLNLATKASDEKLQKIREAAIATSLKVDATITDKALLSNKYGSYAEKEYNIGGDNISVIKQAEAVIAAQIALQAALNSTSASMKDIETATAKANIELAKLSAVSKNAAAEAKPLPGSFEWVKGMAKRAVEYVAIYGGIYTAITSAKKAVEVTIEMEDALSKLAAVLNITKEEAEQYQQAIIKVGKTVGGTMKELNEASLILARAGVAPNDLAKTTEAVVRLTALTGDTLASATQGVVSYYEVFGKAAESQGRMAESVEKITASLGYFSNSTRASMADINTFAGYALTAGAAIGADIDLINGMGAALISAGQSASRAGTNLRRMFTMLNDDSKEVIKIFDTIGISQEKMLAAVNEGKGKEAFKTFLTALSSLTQEQFNKLTHGMDVLTKESVQSMYNLAKSMIEKIDEAAAYTYEEFQKSSETALSSFKTTWDKFVNSIIEATSSLGKEILPLVIDIISGIQQSLNSLLESGVFENIGVSVKDIGDAFINLYDAVMALLDPVRELLSLFISPEAEKSLSWAQIFGTSINGWAMIITIVASSFSHFFALVKEGLLEIEFYSLKAARGLLELVPFMSDSSTMQNINAEMGKKGLEVVAQEKYRQSIINDLNEKIKQMSQTQKSISTTSDNYLDIFKPYMQLKRGMLNGSEAKQAVLDALASDMSKAVDAAHGDAKKIAELNKAYNKALENVKLAAGESPSWMLKDIFGSNKKKDISKGQSEESFAEYFRKQIVDFTKGSSDILAAYEKYEAKIAEIKNRYYKNGKLKDKASQEQFNILNNLAKIKLDLDIEAARHKFTEAMNDIDISMQVAAGTMSTFDAELKKIDDNLAFKLNDLTTRLKQAENIQDPKERERTVAVLKEQIVLETQLGEKQKEQVRQKEALFKQQLALNQALKALELQKIIDQTNLYTKSLYGEQEAIRKLNEEYDYRKKEIQEKMKVYGTESEEYKKLEIELKNLDKERAVKLKQIQAEYSYAAMTINALFDNLNKSFEQGIFDALTGGFISFKKWSKKFFKNLWNDVARGLSKSLADNITSDLKILIFGGGNSRGFSLPDFIKGASVLAATTTSVSAADMSNLVENFGFTSSGTGELIGTLNGQSVIIDEATGAIKQGGDALSQVLGWADKVSTLKTVYDAVTSGIANSVAKPFMTVADILYKYKIIGANTANSISAFGSNFGAGLTFHPAGVGTAGGMIGGTLTGGLLGYGVGRGLDALFGAKTYAPVTGAIAGAGLGLTAMTAGLSAIPGWGWAAAGALTLLGGLFGKKKVTDSGLYFQNSSPITEDNLEGSVQAYAKWKKKSLFKTSKGTKYSALTSEQISSIRSLFKTYDYLLEQLDINKKIFINTGKYSGNTFVDELAKNFISLYTDIPRSDTLDAIYRAWADYAKSINKTVGEAFTETIGQFITTKRSFTEWKLGFEGKDLELLQYKAQNAQKDFEMLAESMGVSGVTIENFVERMEEAVKANFTPENIKNWENLGGALRAAAEAQKAYTEALKHTSKVIDDTIENIVMRNATVIENLEYISKKFTKIWGVAAPDNIEAWIKFGESIKGTIPTDEQVAIWQSLGNALAKVQDETINTLKQISEARLTQLEKEKDMINSITKMLTSRIYTQVNNTDFGFDSEIRKAKIALQTGQSYNISDLQEATNAYADKILNQSVSRIEYIQKIAQLREQINELRALASQKQNEAQSDLDKVLSLQKTLPKLEFADGGIVTAPTNAIIGEAGYPEAVIPLKDGRGVKIDISGLQKEFSEMKQELYELKSIFIKNTAEMIRMSKVFTRLDTGDALSVRIAS